MKNSAKIILAFSLSLVLILTGIIGAVAESKWPTTTIQYYVPATSGGGTDLCARVFTSWLAEKTGRSMVVTNQPQGSGAVAANSVANSKKDGSSLMFAHTGALIASATGSLPFSMVNDFTTIAYIPTVTNYCLIVNAKSDFQTVQDLVDAAKADPGKITFGVATGASTHMMAASLAMDAECTFNYVEAGADTEKVAALVGGHIQASLVNPNNAKQFQDSGDIRILGVFANSEDRCEAFPDVPNLQEFGWKNCTYSVDFVVWGPKGMKDEDVQKIHDLIAEATEDPAVLEQCTRMNFPLLPCLGLEEGQAKLSETDAQYRGILALIGLAK